MPWRHAGTTDDDTGRCLEEQEDERVAQEKDANSRTSSRKGATLLTTTTATADPKQQESAQRELARLAERESPTPGARRKGVNRRARARGGDHAGLFEPIVGAGERIEMASEASGSSRPRRPAMDGAPTQTATGSISRVVLARNPQKVEKHIRGQRVSSDAAHLKTEGRSRATTLNESKENRLSIDQHDDAFVEPIARAQAPLQSKEDGMGLELPGVAGNASTSGERNRE